MKKRADGRYQLKVTLPGGEVKFLYGKTQREVKEKKEELLMMYGRGVINTRNITLAEWASIWWETVKKGKTGYSSQTSYKMSLNNYIIPRLGHMKVQDIRTVHLQEFINSVDKSRASQEKIMITLNGIFDYAVMNNILYGNPGKYVELHGRNNKRQALTTEQQNELLKAVKGHRDEIIIYLALYLGLRRGEIAGLQWNDFDAEKRMVHIQRAVEFRKNEPYLKNPKTSAGDRVIPVPDKLWNMLSQQPKQSIFVVCRKDGTMTHPSRYTYLLRQLSKKLSFHLTLHMLRHTYATTLDLIGVSPKTCQYLLGHASLQITKDTYTHILPEHLIDAKDLLNSL